VGKLVVELKLESKLVNCANYRNPSTFVPAGDARISFVDVRDIAAIAVHALTSTNGKHEGKAHNISGGEALSHGQAAEILSEQLGKKVNYINVSDEESFQRNLLLSFPQRFCNRNSLPLYRFSPYTFY
jgi:uncharacterized protein YbjT (DUF2867 family)